MERDAIPWSPAAAALGLGVAALGCIVLFGWAFDIAALKSVLPNLASMKFNTALGLALDGGALWQLARSRSARNDRIAQLCAGIGAALAALTLLEYATGLDLGIDQLVFFDRDTPSANLPGRMSVVTAVCFVLAFCASLAARGRSDATQHGFLVAAFLGAVLAFLALIGYSYGADLLYRPLPSTSIALHTSIGFLALFGGLLALRPDLGLVALLNSSRAGGAIARPLVPAILIALPVFGWLRLQGEEAGYYDTRSGLAFVITFSVLLFVGLLWSAGRRADLLDLNLRASERRYRQVVEEIEEAIWLHADGKILFANRHAASVFGAASPEVLVGHAVLELFHESDRPRAAARIERLYEQQSVEPTEMRMVRLDGRTIVVRIKAIGIIENGRPCIMSTCSDITAQYDAQMQLQQAQKMEAIGRLTGGVAHDFNNLLTVILGNAELLTLESIRDDQRIELARAMEHAALRGSDLTRHLLAFSRRQPLQPRRLDANTLIAGLRPLLRRTLGEDIDLQVRHAAEPRLLLADPAQVESALLNLAVNARDAMPAGGRLAIETANIRLDDDYAAQNAEVVPGDYVMLAVTDSGTGMPDHVLERAFEPFFTTKEPGKGTGLGLSMVFGFAKQSRGHVKIYSEVGHGTVVKLYLPCADGAAADTTETRPAPDLLPRGSETIFVVEDDPDVRAFATNQLRSLGYTVLEAPNGPRALELCTESATFDLLLTDVIMPGGMTGRDLADKMQERYPDLKILYMSGYTEDSILHQGRLVPGVHLLSKPFRRSDLATMVRKILDLPR